MNQTNHPKVHTKPLPHGRTEAESMEVARASQPKTTKKTLKGHTFDPQVFLATVGLKRTITQCRPGQKIFSQGDASDSVFYIQKGRVKLTIISEQGKEAVIAILGAGDFLGEACLMGQVLRVASATAIVPSALLRIQKDEMLRVLQKERALSGLFISYLLSRNVRIEEDLVDQLFNSTEKRLARTLLLLARYGKEGSPETVVPEIDQETLAEMIGVTRERVNFFMNKFRKLGFIDYNGGLQIHSSLLNVVLHE
jgi:CRP/FNR family transcriptional regulator, cyclic AMP receptor protein